MAINYLKQTGFSIEKLNEQLNLYKLMFCFVTYTCVNKQKGSHHVDNLAEYLINTYKLIPFLKMKRTELCY